MWKHIPAKTCHQLKSGDLLQARWGMVPSYEIRITTSDRGLKATVYTQQGHTVNSMQRKFFDSMQIRSDFNSLLHGAALDISVPSELDNTVKPISAEVKPSNGVCPTTVVHDPKKDLTAHVYTSKPAVGDTFVLKGILTSKVVAFVNFSHANCIVRDANGSVIEKIPNEEFNWNRVTRPLEHHVSLYMRNDSFAEFYRALMAKVAADKVKKAERQAAADAVRAAKLAEKAAAVTGLCPNGAKAIPENFDEEEAHYIIWCPTSDRPPRVVLVGARQAKAVAASMSERHGTEFYWCKLVGKASQKKVTTTKTEITLL